MTDAETPRFQGRIRTRPLADFAFSPFGEIIADEGAEQIHINDGRCIRHNRLATPEVVDGPPIISIFDSEPVELPYALTLMERHPLGSQAFMPLGPAPWLMIVAERDEHGAPARPMAFMVPPGVGVNIHRGVWHAPLTPLRAFSRFLVVDRGGTDNVEEARYDPPWEVVEAI